MEFYTILAEKNHLITSLESREEKLQTKIKDLEGKNDQIEKIAREGNKKQDELKDIINKMNQKVLEAERSASTSKNETDYLRKENTELKK